MYNPFPAEKMINENEFYNFVCNTFINIPFAAYHQIIFEVTIRVDNLYRGWEFWNTDALPVE